MPRAFDVIVIGSGVIGLSTAYLLSKRGLKIGVVAPLDDDQATTAAAGAMIDSFGEIEELNSKRKISKLDYEVKAQRRYSSWLEELEEDSDQKIFSQKGIVVVANGGGEHDIPKMKLMREKMIEYGEDFEGIEVSDVVGLLPNYIYRAHEAFLSKTGRCVDPSQLSNALKKECLNSLKTEFVDARVRSVSEASAGSWMVQLDIGEALFSSKVVVGIFKRKSTQKSTVKAFNGY